MIQLPSRMPPQPPQTQPPPRQQQPPQQHPSVIITIGVQITGEKNPPDPAPRQHSWRYSLQQETARYFYRDDKVAVANAAANAAAATAATASGAASLSDYHHWCSTNRQFSDFRQLNWVLGFWFALKSSFFCISQVFFCSPQITQLLFKDQRNSLDVKLFCKSTGKPSCDFVLDFSNVIFKA
ncbi:hypothetical protein J5N97_013650 [Dioscorea zingiberensis]|uniref:Uncharacterized protein n=1 Tax=Dioscorea zingiberensis TaxID=325984 RepID=A0A9D5CR75_9LILI|nr:hypothetical protein J5N97_013650 [Dioscorea zingiberensis]